MWNLIYFKHNLPNYNSSLDASTVDGSTRPFTDIFDWQLFTRNSLYWNKFTLKTKKKDNKWSFGSFNRFSWCQASLPSQRSQRLPRSFRLVTILPDGVLRRTLVMNQSTVVNCLRSSWWHWSCCCLFHSLIQGLWKLTQLDSYWWWDCSTCWNPRECCCSLTLDEDKLLSFAPALAQPTLGGRWKSARDRRKGKKLKGSAAGWELGGCLAPVESRPCQRW